MSEENFGIIKQSGEVRRGGSGTVRAGNKGNIKTSRPTRKGGGSIKTVNWNNKSQPTEVRGRNPELRAGRFRNIKTNDLKKAVAASVANFGTIKPNPLKCV